MHCAICSGLMQPRNFSIPAYECTECPYVKYLCADDAAKMAPITNILNEYLVEEHRKQEWKNWWGVK